MEVDVGVAIQPTIIIKAGAAVADVITAVSIGIMVEIIVETIGIMAEVTMETEISRITLGRLAPIQTIMLETIPINHFSSLT